MSYEKLNNYVAYCRAMQEADLDVLSITSSPKGFGKSSAIIQIGIRYFKNFGLVCNNCQHEWIYTGKALILGKYEEIKIKPNLFQPCPKCKSENVSKGTRFNFDTYLAYDNEEVRKKIFELPNYSPLLGDEGVRFMMGEDWMLYESKEMKKLFAQMRTKHLLFLTNIPKFKWMDRKYRDDMATFWLRILKRGLCILMQPDLGETEDPWHMKKFQELLGSYFYFTSDADIVKRAEKIVSKHPCAFDYFKIPPVPDDIYQQYKKARDKKVFDNTKKEQKIGQKELAKISAWNFINKWHEILGAIKNSKFDKPTYRMTEQFLFSNPKTEEKVVAFSTIRNWVQEISRIMKK